MVLIIDNYDSFVYNLAQYLGELGWQPVVYRNDQITLAQIEELAPSHIIISPGPCTPLEAGISNEVVRHFGGKIPILGVCLGHQCIGTPMGVRLDEACRSTARPPLSITMARLSIRAYPIPFRQHVTIP